MRTVHFIFRTGKIFLPVVFLLLISSQGYAQRAVERSLILNPLENPHVVLKEGESGWLTQAGGWGSFGSYFISGDEDHAWQQQLGAYAEIYRRGNRASLALTGHVEVIADRRNDINFSPRAVVWEEGFLYTHRIRQSYLQAGYYHRCKHDVDNLRFFEERTLVFGSALARLILPLNVYAGGDSWLSVQYDHYTITWEKRRPDPLPERMKYWGDLIHSLKINALLAKPLGESSHLYMDGYLMGTRMKEEFLLNGMIRLEVGKETAAGQIRLGIHTEYLADSGVSVYAPGVLLSGIGIRLMPAGVFR